MENNAVLVGLVLISRGWGQKRYDRPLTAIWELDTIILRKTITFGEDIMRKKVKKVTIEDVARYAGVSKATVSRFLNKVPGSMSAETHVRVAEAIEELEYKPNVVARSLRGKASRTIAVLVSSILNPYTKELTRGIEDVCNEHEYSMVLCNTEDDQAKQQKYIDILVAKQMDGYIIQPAPHDYQSIRRLVDSSLPVVLVDRTLPQSYVGVDAVIVNNELSARNAVKYLLALGHRRIGTFTVHPSGVSSRQDRLMGYVRALKEEGIPPCQDYIKVFAPGRGEAEKCVRELLGLDDPPTAVLTMNGWITLEVLTVLKELRVRIPEEMSVLGFDDPDWARLVEPPLTAVSQPARQLGKVAAELLFEKLFGDRDRSEQRFIEMETTFIERSSCERYPSS